MSREFLDSEYGFLKENKHGKEYSTSQLRKALSTFDIEYKYSNTKPELERIFDERIAKYRDYLRRKVYDCRPSNTNIEE